MGAKPEGVSVEEVAPASANTVDLMFPCRQCKTDSFLNPQQIRSSYECIMFMGPVRCRLKSVVFTDCANAYSSISSIAAGSADKAMRLHLTYIRGNASANILSFCDAILTWQTSVPSLGPVRLIGGSSCSPGYFSSVLLAGRHR